MILTGKCKEDFLKWYCKTDSEIKTSLLTSLFLSKSNIEKNAFVLEFFDSVDIQINIITIQGGDYELFIRVNKFYIINIDNRLNTRQEATTEAIKKANEIYNNR